MGTELTIWIAAVICGGAAAAAVLWLVLRLPAPTTRTTATGPAPPTKLTILFQNDILIDCSSEARAFLDRFDTWPEMRRWLSDRFDALPLSLTGLPDRVLTGSNSAPHTDLVLDPLPDGAVRLTLHIIEPMNAVQAHDLIQTRSELQLYKTAILSSPSPIWASDINGQILWRNDPSKPLLDTIPPQTGLPRPDTPGARYNWTDPDTGDHRVFTIDCRETETGLIHYATDVTASEQSERDRNTFVQTLTKTFATLNTGLVVFDRYRRLVMFNPALVDLTGLPVDFLSTMPDLTSFFDMLRDKRVMPEPRDYGTWREQIADIIASAEDGIYQETWSLPAQVTYRVTGRPHPDGAVAFLFEDISADMLLSRRLHAELETREALLDAMPHPVVLLSEDGVATMTNDPFRRAFGTQDDHSPADLTLDMLFDTCASAYPHPKFWTSLKRAAQSMTRSQTVKGGANLLARTQRLPDGGCMIIFEKLASQPTSMTA